MIKKGVQKVTSFLVNYFIYTCLLLPFIMKHFLDQKSTKNGSFLTSFLTKKVSFLTSFWRPNRQLSGSDLSQKGCPKSDPKRSLFGHFWHFWDPQKWPLFGGVFPLLATTLPIARDGYMGSGQRCSKRGSFWTPPKTKTEDTFKIISGQKRPFFGFLLKKVGSFSPSFGSKHVPKTISRGVHAKQNALFFGVFFSCFSAFS